ncbi:MAG: helix-turn-helix domain-containing protein [Cyanobacteria bacterium P01_A01_bin.114]
MPDVNPNRSILDAQPYLRQTLELVSDKWATSVIYVLTFGTKRYSDLQNDIGGVSQRMLTRTLRNLQQDGLVQRTVYDEQPPRVEYALTPLGQSLVDPLRGLCQWAIANFDAVEAARNKPSESDD